MPPLTHLTGFRITQLGHGSVVASMPVTPWLAHPDGAIDAGMMAAHVTLAAAVTTAPPRVAVEPVQLTYSPVRKVEPQGSVLVGRAQVLRTAPYWVYAEGTVEDGEGRVVARTTGHFLFSEPPFPVPGGVVDGAPIESPTYATPDPYERPLPADRYAAFHLYPEHGGVEATRMMIEGSAPRAPLYELLGIIPVEVEEGRYTSELVTSDWLQLLPGQTHPSPLAAFIGDCAGAASWSVAPPGTQVATLHVALTLKGFLHCDGRRYRATGQAARVGEHIIHTSVRIADGNDVVGEGTMSCLLRPVATRTEPTARVLATVLFTDIVDSTAQAERFGDSEWNEVLARHHEIVRTELARARGRLIKSTGDGALATFDSPTRALQCARAIRDAVRRIGLEVRAGLHTGDVDVTGGDVTGIAVHIASRVESAAGVGEVWVSETVRALAAGSGIAFKDQGRHALKGIDDEVQLYSMED